MNTDQVTLNSARHAAASAVPAPPRILLPLLKSADVRIDGSRAWDMQVLNARLYRRAIFEGSLGIGESYMDGDWECEALDELFARLLRADADARPVGLARLKMLAQALRHRLVNLQSVQRAFQVGQQHYDAGNDVFEAMLDSRMVYSCGYWQRAVDLEQAQHDKLEMICRKLDLQPGQTLLDVGCGWGGLAQFASERHGVSVVGATVSKEQLVLAQRRCEGLPVTLRLQDWREISGRFDRIVSVGMFEHVGPKNYDAYFQHMRRLLAPGGLFLLHTIGAHVTQAATDPWIDRYVFRNGKLPSARELAAAVEGQFLIEDWHNFGDDYDRTLMAWWANFDRAWPRLQARYDRRFYRLWKYYLLSCAGFFRSRQGLLWQLVLSGRERTQTYRSVRLA